jgi:glycosyltransferase involved in cell wall biosynthesis
MQELDMPLIICGDGNFKQKAESLTTELGLENKVIFKGMLTPVELRQYSQSACVGITLFEKSSYNNYLSLANRFFDYIQAGTPQLCVNYPTYKEINDKWQVACMIDNPSVDEIVNGLKKLTNNEAYWQYLHENCVLAGAVLNWEEESKKLIEFYQGIFGKASSYHHS